MTITSKPARVLIIAGSDPGGGAGIQADIKTVTALGGYAMTAITALTAQNTQGVFGVHDVPIGFVHRQIELVASDIGVDAIKTGMLHSTAVIETVAEAIQRYCPNVPVIVDPVMIAKGGHPLLQDEAMVTLRRTMPKLATVLTPNLPEAEALVGFPVQTEDDMRRAGEALLKLGSRAILIKGGHLPGTQVIDLLVSTEGSVKFEDTRIETHHTHGTGCTLASAIATGIAQGLTLEAAIRRARAYVLEAIRTAPGFGQGHGPLNHMHTVRKF